MKVEIKFYAERCPGIRVQRHTSRLPGRRPQKALRCNARLFYVSSGVSDTRAYMHIFLWDMKIADYENIAIKKKAKEEIGTHFELYR